MRSEVGHGVDVAPPIAAPRHPARYRTHVRRRNRRVVTPTDKAAAHGRVGYVGKAPAIDVGRGYLQHPAIKATFQVVEVAEAHLRQR